MPGKTKEQETKITAEAKSTPKSRAKATADKKMSKGDEYLCEVCALSLHVDICGEFLESKGPVCCGQPMKKKTGAAK
jgi:hypothetical protein